VRCCALLSCSDVIFSVHNMCIIGANKWWWWWWWQHTHITTFVRDCPGEPVPEEALTHPPSWSSSNPYQLLPSTTIHSIFFVQITCLAIFLHNLFSCPLWSTSWSGALYLIKISQKLLELLESHHKRSTDHFGNSFIRYIFIVLISDLLYYGVFPALATPLSAISAVAEFPPLILNFDLWPWSSNMTQKGRAKYLSQRSFISKVNLQTHGHTHTGLIVLHRSLNWWVNIRLCKINCF